MNRPRFIIVYYIGGATFEEAEIVTQMNKHFGKQTDIVLGSGKMLNSKSFLENVKKAYGRHVFRD